VYLRTGNRQLIKDINRYTVLNAVKNYGPVSRTGLAQITGLGQSTITGITKGLIAQGLIYEKTEGESSGGRPPILLELDRHAGYVVGVKLMEDRLSVALADLDANVLVSEILPLSATSDVNTTLVAISDVIRKLVEQNISADKLLGVGIGISGVVDADMGICLYSPILRWQNIPLRDVLEAHLNVPVVVDNDVNTLTIAEQWFGAGKDVPHFLVVTVGRGVGMGIVVNGQFYRGANGGAGELGHTTFIEDGIQCGCGKRGCLEAYTADSAIVRSMREAIAQNRSPLRSIDLTLDDIVHWAEAGDEAAQASLAQAGHYLGIAIANLVNVFNPSLVIVSGEGVRVGRFRMEPMQQAIRRHVFNGLGDRLEIIIEPLGDETWARGAAGLVLGELFKPPIYQKTLDVMATRS
jgi:N-acetylglucosamine repressor